MPKTPGQVGCQPTGQGTARGLRWRRHSVHFIRSQKPLALCQNSGLTPSRSLGLTPSRFILMLRASPLCQKQGLTPLVSWVPSMIKNPLGEAVFLPDHVLGDVSGARPATEPHGAILFDTERDRFRVPVTGESLRETSFAKATAESVLSMDKLVSEANEARTLPSNRVLHTAGMACPRRYAISGVPDYAATPSEDPTWIL